MMIIPKTPDSAVLAKRRLSWYLAIVNKRFTATNKKLMDSTLKLLQIGCGQMGAALLHGVHQSLGTGLTAWVVDPTPQQALAVDGITHYPALTDLPILIKPDIALIAVKPAQVAKVLAELAPLLPDHAVVVSIAAGISLAQLSAALPPTHQEQRLVRAMPNLPAVIGQGITVCCNARPLSHPQQALVQHLFGSAGALVWLEDEEKLDAVTAISGSGPAYLFYFAECLIDAAIAIGLPADLAQQLVLHTLTGSSQLALAKAGTHDVATLRQQVTSPAGTTAAALQVLMDPATGLAPLLQRATMAAKTRGAELRQE
jgi:pyrroline-5-carboxylate reductase